MPGIAIQSVQSLYLELFFEETLLAKGTGFVVTRGNRNFLITARHNFTGRHQVTGKTLSTHGGVPNKVRIWHNCSWVVGTWIKIDAPLLSGEEPLWFEHPALRSEADIVALELIPRLEVSLMPYDIQAPARTLDLFPTDMVSVIGFPFGVGVRGKLAVWTTGFIASEPEVNFDDKPQFLIDSRTRQGQSGSPVIAFRTSPVKFGPDYYTFDQPYCEFLGIYSGRINDDSDIGMVWKRAAIEALVSGIP